VFRCVWLPSLAACALGGLGALAGGCGDEESAKKQQAQRAAHRARAEACFDQGRYGCAMKAFRAALATRPKDPALLNRFAMAARLRYYVTGEADYRDQELVALRRAVAHAPDQPTLLVNFATTCYELGRWPRAAWAYRRALRIEPNHPDAALMRRRIKRSAAEAERSGKKE
jgi:tetratricopeptide (TPR) repeat protein